MNKPNPLRAEGFDPDDPAVIAAIDLVRWELSLVMLILREPTVGVWPRSVSWCGRRPAVDGSTAAALPARAPVAARPDAGRNRGVLVRPASDVALRVRRSHLRAGAGRRVQLAARAGAGARLAAIGADASTAGRTSCQSQTALTTSKWSLRSLDPHGQGRIDWPPEIDAALVRRGCPRPGR